MAWSFLSKLASAPVKEVLSQAGRGVGSVMNRFGFTEKMSESDRMDKILSGFKISESSTDSARKMAMEEMRTQKQPWIIRLLNGFIRPFGGLGSLATLFYSIWAENLSIWAEIEYRPVNISTEQHIMLGTIIAFYFGSRLKEVLNGNSTKR